jgi:hypothetical protein
MKVISHIISHAFCQGFAFCGLILIFNQQLDNPITKKSGNQGGSRRNNEVET